jgi:hypothetical protein
MKIKALAITSLLVAAGALQGQAQEVSSANAVGYVKKTFGAGFSLFSNPLMAEDNTVAALLPGVPTGTVVYKFDPATGFSSNTFVGVWLDSAMTLVPGEGAFINVPAGSTAEAIFVGEVPQGNLVTEFPAGFSLASSQVPQAGLIATDLGLNPASVSNVYTFDNATQSYSTFTPIPGLGFLTEPTVAIGEAVFLEASAAGNWTRDFTVSE